MLDRPLPLRRRAACGASRSAATRYILVEFPRLVAADAVTNALVRVPRAGPDAGAGAPRALQLLLRRGGDALAGARRRDAGGCDDAATPAGPRASGRASSSRTGWLTFWPATTTVTSGRSPAGADFLRAQDGDEQAELLTVREPRRDPARPAAGRVPPLRIRRTWMQPAPAYSGGRAVSRAASRRGLDSLAAAGRRVKALSAQVAQVAARYVEVLRSGGTLYFCGNGGSAADAQHLAAEYVVRYVAATPTPWRPWRSRTDTSHPHRRRQRSGVRAGLCPPGRGALRPWRPPGPAQHQRPQPEPDRRGPRGAGRGASTVSPFWGRAAGRWRGRSTRRSSSLPTTPV